MSRQEIYKEIEEMCGMVPEQFKVLTDETLEPSWQMFKRYQMSEDTLIPPKYKQLIGLAVAGAIRCPYCTLFHTEASKLMGATTAEIEEVAMLTRETAGWSAYLNTIRLDMERFKSEVGQIVEFIKTKTLQRGT